MINASIQDVTVGVDRLFTTPLYWNLPKLFNGDRVTSYNGFLRFTTTSNADATANGQTAANPGATASP